MSLCFSTGPPQTLRELIENHPLDTEDIKLLSVHSDQYIIPYIQTYVKRCALVLFSTEERINATEEADVMSQSLVSAGFDTKRVEWTRDLPLVIIPLLSELVSQGVSLLVISIMCHGKAGMLTGSGNYKVSISDILQVLRERLPSSLPLVSCFLPFYFRFFIWAVKGFQGVNGNQSDRVNLIFMDNFVWRKNLWPYNSCSWVSFMPLAFSSDPRRALCAF